MKSAQTYKNVKILPDTLLKLKVQAAKSGMSILKLIDVMVTEREGKDA